MTRVGVRDLSNDICAAAMLHGGGAVCLLAKSPPSHGRLGFACNHIVRMAHCPISEVMVFHTRQLRTNVEMERDLEHVGPCRRAICCARRVHRHSGCTFGQSANAKPWDCTRGCTDGIGITRRLADPRLWLPALSAVRTDTRFDGAGRQCRSGQSILPDDGYADQIVV